MIESSVVHQWHSTWLDNGRMMEECILTFKAGAESFTVKSKDLPDRLRYWLPLLQCHIVSIRPMFRGSLSLRTFHGIRLGCNAVTSYNIRFLRSEALLNNVLKDCDVVVEGPTTMHAKYSIFASKRKHVDDYSDALPLAFGAHVDLVSHSISDRMPTPQTLEPIHIVCGHASSPWMQRCATIAGTVPTLVVTCDPDAWLALPMSSRATHVSRTQLKENWIFVISEDELESAYYDQETEYECFSKMISSTTNTVPNRLQVQRFIWNKFSVSYPDASISVANVQWPCVVDHTKTLLVGLRGTERHIVVVQQPHIKGTWPSFPLVADIYDISHEAAKASVCLWSQYLTCLDVPRALLRTIKLRIEVVKPTLAEVRLSSLGLPWSSSMMMRMSPVVFGPQQVSDLVRQIFAMAPISMARRLRADALFHSSLDYVLSQIATPTCCVCFDDCEEKTLTLCGHVFCKDCSVVLLSDPVKNAKAIVCCPYCRSDIGCGDFFSVSHTVTESVMLKRSKSFPPTCVPVDEAGDLGIPTLLPDVLPDKSTIVVASLIDVPRFVNKLLSLKRQTKVTVLSNNESWVEDLQELLK